MISAYCWVTSWEEEEKSLEHLILSVQGWAGNICWKFLVYSMVICLEQGLTFFRIYSGFLKWSSFLQSSYLPSQVFWRHWNFISGASGIKHLWTHDSTHLSNSQEKNQKILSLVLQINECVIIHQLYSRKVKTLGDSLCLGKKDLIS